VTASAVPSPSHSLGEDVPAIFIGTLFVSFGVVLFRHQASLGGVNILALYLQDKYGLRAGRLQMIVDVTILLASYVVVSPIALAASVIGAVSLNLVIWINHRQDRYIGWSAP
jgi:uncharacterized membrane-anchored protein YitT (DUF2179 family)